MALGPSLGALALGDDAVFLGELIRGLLDGLFGLEQAGAGSAAQFEVPVLGDLLGVGKAFFVRALAVILVFVMSRTLPESAVVALIDEDFATHDRMADHGTSSHVQSV